MDAKTLEKMTVIKLREEAHKFPDIVGAHGMNKAHLLTLLKQKYGITEVKSHDEILTERKHALKKKILQLKAARAEEKDPKKLALLQRRLRQQRHLLNKTARRMKLLEKQAA